MFKSITFYLTFTTWAILLSAIPNTLMGQTGNINGFVVGENEEAVSLAVIELLEAQNSTFITGTIADDLGMFSIDDVAAGTYVLRVSSLGYEITSTEPFELGEGEEKGFGRISIQISATDLAEVVVKTHRPVLEQKIDMTVLNLSTMITKGKNSLDILRFGPGLMVTDAGEVTMNNKSSLMIMINGKPQRSEGQKLGTILRAIPAESIERVEVISNPSSRYDAAGSAGIINIVLKTSGVEGTKYFLDQNIQYSVNDRWRTSLTINHRRKKFHIWTNLYYSFGSFDFPTLGYRIGTIDGQEVLFDQDFSNDQFWRSPTYTVGANYYLTEKSRLSFFTEGFHSQSGSDQVNVSRISSNGGETIDSILTTFYDNPHDRHITTYNLSYLFEDTTGQRFSIDLDFGDNDFNQKRSILSESESLLDNSLFTDERFLDMDNLIQTYSGKVDWVRPLSKEFTFETGAKVAFSNVDHFLDSSHRPNGAEVLRTDSLQTNDFFYDEHIRAAYTNFSYKRGKIGLQAGLRAEQTRIDGRSVDLFENNILRPDSTYLNLFPSAFFTYAFSPRHRTRLSYSRRINRPHYSDINPFSYFHSLYSFWQGNSSLGPDLTDSYEVSYSFQDVFDFSVNYSRTTNLTTPFTVQVDGIDINSVKNAGSIEYLNINLSSPQAINDHWNAYVWVGVFAQFYDGEIGNAPLTYNIWGVNSYMSHTYRWNGWAVEASGWFNSVNRRIMQEYSAHGAFNLSIGKEILNKKGYVKLAINDIFRTQPKYTTTDFNTVQSRIRTRIESRGLSLSFNYNFGNESIKDGKRSSNGSEEQDRAD